MTGIRSLSLSEQLAWYDEVIISGLSTHQSHTWCQDLLSNADIQLVKQVIQKWRAGEPIVEIERVLYPNQTCIAQNELRQKGLGNN